MPLNRKPTAKGQPNCHTDSKHATPSNGVYGTFLPDVRVLRDHPSAPLFFGSGGLRDLFAFGMEMTGQAWNSPDYRYGFNGMEKDDEIKGTANSYDFGARLYDPRVGRWWSRDPLEAKYTELSPYCMVANNPVLFFDYKGGDIHLYSYDGKLILVIPKAGELEEYRIMLPGFMFDGEPVNVDQALQKAGIARKQNRYGVDYPDVAGISLEVSGAFVGGMSIGIEVVQFQRGNYTDSYQLYFKFGGVIGWSAAGGMNFLAGWSSLPDKDIDPESYTGISNSFFLTLKQFPISGGIFWGDDEGDLSMNPTEWSRNTWTGFNVGIPPFGAGSGAGWSAVKYWHAASFGGEEDPSGIIKRVEQGSFKVIQSSHVREGRLEVNECEITSDPPVSECDE